VLTFTTTDCDLDGAADCGGEGPFEDCGGERESVCERERE
jgi:hypothetical protein